MAWYVNDSWVSYLSPLTSTSYWGQAWIFFMALGNWCKRNGDLSLRCQLVLVLISSGWHQEGRAFSCRKNLAASIPCCSICKKTYMYLFVTGYHAMDASEETTSQSSAARPTLPQRTIFINQPQSRTYCSNQIRYRSCISCRWLIASLIELFVVFGQWFNGEFCCVGENLQEFFHFSIITFFNVSGCE